jgi:hypothetical protein
VKQDDRWSRSLPVIVKLDSVEALELGHQAGAVNPT